MGLHEGIENRGPLVLEEAEIIQRDPLGDDHFLATFRTEKMAPLAKPGQFVHVKTPFKYLRNPLSILDAEGDCLKILFRAIGTGTRLLADLPLGTKFSFAGPLGQGYRPRGAIWICVAGGYGIAPLLYLLKKYQGQYEQAHFIYGARSRNLLKQKEATSKYATSYLCTEDGSEGIHGQVVVPLQELLQRLPRAKVCVYSCGPTPMLKAVGALCLEHDVDGQLSLEERMGCAMGSCLGCVAPIKRGDDVVYLRTCTEGPVFDVREAVL